MSAKQSEFAVEIENGNTWPQTVMSKYGSQAIPWTCRFMEICDPKLPECGYWVACEGECYGIRTGGGTAIVTVESWFEEVLGKSAYVVWSLKNRSSWGTWSKKWSKRTSDGGDGQYMGCQRRDIPKTATQIELDAAKWYAEYGQGISLPGATPVAEPKQTVSQNSEPLTGAMELSMKSKKEIIKAQKAKGDKRQDASAVIVLCQSKSNAVEVVKAYSTDGAVKAVSKAYPNEQGWQVTSAAPEGAKVTVDATVRIEKSKTKGGKSLEEINGKPLESAPVEMTEKQAMSAMVNEAIAHAKNGTERSKEKRPYVKTLDFAAALIKAGKEELTGEQMAVESHHYYPRWKLSKAKAWFAARTVPETVAA